MKAGIANKSIGTALPGKLSWGQLQLKKLKDGKFLLLLVLPAVVYYILFKYVPMWGILIAFKRYSPFKGFWGSNWVGLQHFKMFFSGPFWWRCVRNTLLLSLYSTLWSFPAPIIFALILNDVQNMKFKKLVQTVSYMPHFLSTVVVIGLLYMFLSPNTGPVQKIMVALGYQKMDIFAQAKYFRTLYIASGIWQSLGWSAIIYLAALTNIDPALYESATIDGANKFQQLIYITLPSIAPTIIIMLLLRLSHILGVGFEKAYLLQNDANHETSDVLETYVYRIGISGANYSYGTAVGLLTSVINLFFLFIFNGISRRVSETSLW
ncbi:MAG TPA: sugar ABC transporter permease [Clostridiaceae bacterium]|nr:sugar ABC transporter permease [Clostridiaceae bacterium]